MSRYQLRSRKPAQEKPHEENRQSTDPKSEEFLHESDRNESSSLVLPIKGKAGVPTNPAVRDREDVVDVPEERRDEGQSPEVGLATHYVP